MRKWWLRWFGWAHVNRLQLENAQLHLRVRDLEEYNAELEQRLADSERVKLCVQTAYFKRHGDQP